MSARTPTTTPVIESVGRQRSEFRVELQALLNRYSMENGSSTPDFLLADFLTHCLEAFDLTVRERDRLRDRS